MKRSKMIKFIQENDAIYAKVSFVNYADDHLLLIYNRIEQEIKLASQQEKMKREFVFFS